MPLETVAQKSELRVLLEKPEGLSLTECARALELVENPVYSDKNCVLCSLSSDSRAEIGKAIYDTPFCQEHLRYALI